MSKDIIKPGIVLLIVTVIAAGLLGAVNIATKDTIAKVEAEAKEKSMQEVLPDAKSFNTEQTKDDIKKQTNDDKAYSIIKSYSEGLDENGNTVGYTFSVSTKGFSTGLNLMVGITKDGVISGVDILSHGETPGLGANADSDWINQFTDKSGKLEVIKGDSPKNNEVQAITGATITSKAVTNAVNTVTDFYENVINSGSGTNIKSNDKKDSISNATSALNNSNNSKGGDK